MDGLRILTIINAVLICIFCIGGIIYIPEFAVLFKGFGVDLPLATVFVLKSYKYWAIGLLIPIFIYIKYLTLPEISINTERNILIINISLLIFLALLLPLLIFTMYLPVFEMGKTING